MSHLPDKLVKELAEHYEFQFDTTENENTIAVETTLDEEGLHVYGSGEAIVEFLLMVGHAVGENAHQGDWVTEMVDLTEGAWIREVSGPSGDVELQMPKFLVGQKDTAADAG